VRLVQINTEEFQLVLAMHRLRHADLRLEREVRELRRANEISKAASALPRSSTRRARLVLIVTGGEQPGDGSAWTKSLPGRAAF
jgi:hypothetical protein